ncbi:hypothetical protein QBC37DRAFT_401210 [Rhypophila decipiens]|uniref:Uncharacterized protein n=1 Tax=Rhypophila decipiens TaxID=261697 RepID=A0AAN6Y5B8_9PEZI|nr:hypothetical protein QBC37DRAFT_401210 [Rhypophila decipiens]
MYRQASTSSQLLLFYLPDMNQISVIFEDAIFLVDLGAATREFRWPNNSPPPPSNLKSLEVEKIHERHLGHLLSVTPSLRSLTWTRPYYVGKLSETGGSSAVYPAIFSLDDIMSSLTLVRDTLTELRLRAVDRTGPCRWGARRPDVRSLSLARFADSATSLSLAQFENLRILEIPNVFIMGNIQYESADSFLQRPILQTNLPPRLEELTLTGKLAPIFISHCEFDSRQEIPYLDQILSWLEDPEFSNSCHLRKLGYYSNWTDEELREESAEVHLRKRHILMDITLKAGIDFVFEYPPPSQDMEALGEI